MTGHGSSVHPIGAFRAALTGGVGSGKSTVGELLAGRGATVIDADIIAREVVEPGTPGLAAIVERFGAGVLTPEATLNRAGLAAIVFSDPAALADLNAITHPLIRARSMQLIDEVPVGSVAIYELPLLAEGGPFGAESFDAIIVVEAPMPIRLTRLAGRGLPLEQAQARIAAQATDEQRRAIADYLIVNAGDLAALESQVDGLWPQLQKRAGEPGPS
jgi:dephospho-CoA kinase